MTSRHRWPLHLTLVCGCIALGGCTTLSPEAQTAALLAQAESALGSAALKTLIVSGRGTAASVGQAYAPGLHWPGLHVTALSRSLNFETARFREEFIRSRSEPLGGGALPLMGSGEARGVVLASADHAWNVVGAATVPAPAALPMRVHDLWTSTPQGAVKAAARAGARAGVRREFLRRWDTLTFTLPGQFSATLVLEDTGLISRIEATVPHPVLGEMPVVTQFLDYRSQAGLAVPSRIVQHQGGFAALDLEVGAVYADETVEITTPDNVQAARETVSVEKVADGVWFLGGGTHNSVAIEMAAQMVLVEAPLGAGRARAVLDATNQLVPGKRALTVINTHHHFDHAGGLRFVAAEGATIVASAPAMRYFEAVFAAPRLQAQPQPQPQLRAQSQAQPQTQAQAPGGPAAAQRKPSFVAVEGKMVLDDAQRPVEIHELRDSIHARGLLAVWLPREQLLIQADAYTPGAPDAPAPARPNANHLNLVQNLDRLGLAPQRILPLHGRVVPAAELYRQVGRPPPQ
jgi:glyoxylase-like metal-dependent hydrolase (beta-lactamase superfamily II)